MKLFANTSCRQGKEAAFDVAVAVIIDPATAASTHLAGVIYGELTVDARELDSSRNGGSEDNRHLNTTLKTDLRKFADKINQFFLSFPFLTLYVVSKSKTLDHHI